MNIYIIIFFAPDQFWFGPDVVHFHWVALKRAEDDDERQFNLPQTKLVIYQSPRILLASCISFGMIVTRLAWMAHKLESSKRPTK